MACTYRFKGTDGQDVTITGKAAMKAALVEGRLDHLLPAGAWDGLTEARFSRNHAGMDDAKNVAGKQAPNPAGDVEQGGATPSSDYRSAVAAVDEIERLSELHGKVFIRWSAGPQYDLAEGAASRDYVSGANHAGLSGVQITDSTHPVDIASGLAEYGFLRMKNSDLRPYVYSGEFLGEDSDGHASFRPSRLLYSPPASAIRAIDRKFLEIYDGIHAIDGLKRRLARITDPNGRTITEKSISDKQAALDSMLEKYGINPNESSASAGSDAQFSRRAISGSLHPQDAEASLRIARKAFPGVPINLHENDRAETVPEDLRNQIDQADANGDVNGAFFRGEVHLFREAIPGIKTFEFTVAHEMTHAGLSGMFGPEINEVMLHINRSNAEVAARAQELQGRYGYSVARSTEEALADMGGDMVKVKGFKRLVALVREWLRKHGFVSRWSDGDVANLVMTARDYAKKPGATTMYREAVFSRSGQAALGTLDAQQQAAVERVFGKPKTMRERAEAFAKDWKKNLVQGVFDQFAPIKDITSKGYMLSRLAKGSDSTLEAMLMYGKVSVDGDGVYQVDFDGKNLNGFAAAMAKLDGEHDRFLAWVSGQRAERLAQVGLENLMTPEDIAALKSLANDKTASGKVRRVLYAEALKELNAFNDSVLKIAADSGLIDGATREMYRDMPYVPFYRLSDEDVVQGPSVSKGLVNQSAWKQLKGGTKQLNEDLMGNLLKNWSHLITASANNRAAKEVLDTAAKMGAATDMTNDVVAQDINGQPIYRGNTKGLVRYRGEIVRKIPKGQPYVESGQTKISDGTAEIKYMGDRYFKVEDPHLMDAIASIGFTPKVWKPMADFKRYLTFGVTVNPTFKIRNLIRDSIQAVGTADLSYNPVKNILMGAKGTEMMSNVRAQMLASGGMLRFGTAEGGYSGHVRRLIEKGVDPQYILDDESKLKAFWKHKVLPAFEAYQELGDRSENVNRAALYEQLIGKGMSHAEASFWARDMMDFSMHGKWAAVRTLTAVVPFMNARLQGIYKLGRATKADYKRMGTTLAAVSLASMALMLAYQDDDDWKKREDWDRDNSWWFKIGGTAYRIPKPFEVGAIGTIAERSLELMINDEMTGKRFGQRMRDLVMQNLSMNPTPQLVKPLIDLYANKEGFTGRDIETQGMEKMRPEDRYTERTSEVARFLGQFGLPNPAQLIMGRWEGLSPVQIDYLIRGYFSWLGTSATNVLDRGIRPLMDRGEQPDMRLRDVFLAGNFVESLPSGSSRYVTQFYDQAKEIEQMYASYQQAIKEGDTGKMQEIRADNPEQFAARRRIEAAKRAQSLISGQMRTIERNRGMSGEEKRARLDDLERRRDIVARRALLAAAPGGD